MGGGAARAKPVIVNQPSLLAICIIPIWVPMIVAGVVALLLSIRGVAALLSIVVCMVTNSAAVLWSGMNYARHHYYLI